MLNLQTKIPWEYQEKRSITASPWPIETYSAKKQATYRIRGEKLKDALANIGSELAWGKQFGNIEQKRIFEGWLEKKLSPGYSFVIGFGSVQY